jgi:hypothetical protein
MEQITTYTHRTREEILAWWRRARDRKEQFQKETDEWWRARQYTMLMSVVKHNSVLYDPETGECLNEETMKMIENVQNGTEKMTTYKSYGDFEKKMRSL